MSTNKIEAWKTCVAKGKAIFVATNVKSIHPVVDRIVSNLCKIDRINYVRVSPDDWEATVVMDWSDGFWDRMVQKYNKIVIL